MPLAWQVDSGEDGEYEDYETLFSSHLRHKWGRQMVEGRSCPIGDLCGFLSP